MGILKKILGAPALQLAAMRAIIRLQDQQIANLRKIVRDARHELASIQATMGGTVDAHVKVTEAHNAERERWSKRLAELTAKAEWLSNERDRLESVIREKDGSVRMLERERDHWKAKANATSPGPTGSDVVAS